MHWPVMSWHNACSMCMHRLVMSQAIACTYCMGSKVSSLYWTYLYSSYFVCETSCKPLFYIEEIGQVPLPSIEIMAKLTADNFLHWLQKSQIDSFMLWGPQYFVINIKNMYWHEAILQGKLNFILSIIVIIYPKQFLREIKILLMVAIYT